LPVSRRTAKDSGHYLSRRSVQIDLPDFTEEAFGEMPPPIFDPPFDCLRQESPKLLNLFVKDFNADLGRPRRIQLFKDILRYCTNRERSLLFQVINRNIPDITKADVVQAFGKQFFAPRAIPQAPAAPVAPVASLRVSGGGPESE
jgi:hypothetical protein